MILFLLKVTDSRKNGSKKSYVSKKIQLGFSSKIKVPSSARAGKNQLGLITNVCASIDRQDCRRKMYVRKKMELDSSFQLDSIDLFKERNLEIFRNDTILLR